MPPARKYTKEDIIKVAENIVKNEGMSNLNARRLAKELGCSVQPIFHNFSSMDEVVKEIITNITNKYHEYMLSGQNSDNPYKAMGLSYIKFAKDYKEFFKILFMQKTDLNVESFVMADAIGDEVIKSGMRLTGLSYESQKKFHVKVWMFTHGIACLVATETVKLTDLEIDSLLQSTVREMLIGYKEAR